MVLNGIGVLSYSMTSLTRVTATARPFRRGVDGSGVRRSPSDSSTPCSVSRSATDSTWVYTVAGSRAPTWGTPLGDGELYRFLKVQDEALWPLGVGEGTLHENVGGRCQQRPRHEGSGRGPVQALEDGRGLGCVCRGALRQGGSHGLRLRIQGGCKAIRYDENRRTTLVAGACRGTGDRQGTGPSSYPDP